MAAAPPSCLQDLIADGAIAQATIDDYFRFRFSLTSPVEFSRQGEQAEVRLTDLEGRCYIQQGTIIVERSAEGWCWSPQWLDSTNSFGIPEFQAHHPVTPAMLAAARTLCGHGTLLFAPDYAVVLPANNPWHSERDSLLVGLPQIPSGVDKRRAILAHSAIWNSQPLSLTDSSAHLADGTQLSFSNQAITRLTSDFSLDDVLSDAWFISSEYDLFLQSFLPSCHLSRADTSESYLLSSPQGRTLRCRGEVIGTLTRNAFHWGWATPEGTSTQSRLLSYTIRNFAVQHGIPELLSPVVARADWDNLEIARVLRLIVNRWICLPLWLEDGSAQLVALENTPFRLPAPTPEVLTAVQKTPTPARVDVQRAWGSYQRYRAASEMDSSLLHH